MAKKQLSVSNTTSWKPHKRFSITSEHETAMLLTENDLDNKFVTEKPFKEKPMLKLEIATGAYSNE
jgi:hypothetical protein